MQVFPLPSRGSSSRILHPKRPQNPPINPNTIRHRKRILPPINIHPGQPSNPLLRRSLGTLIRNQLKRSLKLGPIIARIFTLHRRQALCEIKSHRLIRFHALSLQVRDILLLGEDVLAGA